MEMYLHKIKVSITDHEIQDILWIFSVIVCLFNWGFSSHERIFHLYGDVTIAGEGMQILIYARYLWPLSSEGFVGCTPTVTPDIRL